jgi:hypothetical protein
MNVTLKLLLLAGSSHFNLVLSFWGSLKGKGMCKRFYFNKKFLLVSLSSYMVSIFYAGDPIEKPSLMVLVYFSASI